MKKYTQQIQLACRVFCISHTYSVAQHCLLCIAALFVPAALLQVLTPDILLSGPNVTELCWNISAYQITGTAPASAHNLLQMHL